MEDDTTTVAEPQDQTGAEEALPVQAEATDAADVATAEPSGASQDGEESESSDAPDESNIDDKLKKYATSQGLELDSPNAIKAARIAMKAQSEATRNSRRAGELEKAATVVSDEDAAVTAEATNQDPEVLKRLQRMEVKENIRDFWNDPEHDPSFETKMVEIVGQKPYLAGDLDALYASAVYQSGGVAAVKSQGKKEALTDLAHKQQAAVPTGNSTTRSTPAKKPFKDLSIPEMEKELGIFRQ